MTYSELKTEIEAWMHRGGLSGKVDLFIDLFESRVNRNVRALEMETLATVTPSSEFEPLPTGFLEFRNIQVNGSFPHTVEYASPQKLAITGMASGMPKLYTINGNQVEFSPDATGYTIEWTYYKAIPALSDINTSNWLLASYPDYYLYGCIQQAMLYTRNPDAMGYESMLQALEAGINKRKNTAISGPMSVTAN